VDPMKGKITVGILTLTAMLILAGMAATKILPGWIVLSSACVYCLGYFSGIIINQIER
jgi:hypothetical protein